VERLALGESDESRVLRELGSSESRESAHALLLELGTWDHTVVPYAHRLDVPTSPPTIALPGLPEEKRVDLTHLPAFAIDDEGNQDPDDAVGLEMTAKRRRLWVHIADAAALVPSDSAADLEARARGATLYLPDGNVPMLPPQATRTLGMGLTNVSPAFSFGLDLDGEGTVSGLEIVPSWVRVTRLTYREVEGRLEEEPFHGLYRLAQAFEARRRANGAVHIELPEVKIRVQDGRVVIRSLPPLRSRALVREAMLMTGEATARFALEEGIPFPFATQDPPEANGRAEGPTDDLAGMYALRRSLKPSQRSASPGPHAGLGLDLYARATSPLRRYLDLVAHQQLRAYLRGEEPLEAQEVLRRIGAAEAAVGSVRQAEWLSRRHWTLVYLAQHPDWQGEGILVEKRDRHSTVLIPALALEPRVHLREDLPLNSVVDLVLMGVDLAGLEAHFRVRE
jgi:exoribonuclease-2